MARGGHISPESAEVSNAPSENTDVARKTEVDGKADDPHGNGAHSSTFLDDTDVTSTSTANGYEITIGGDTYEFLE